MRLFILSWLILSSMHAFAQADSLQHLVNRENKDDRKLDLLLQLADATKNSDPARSFHAAQEAEHLAEKLKDARKLAESEFMIALYYNKSDKTDSVLYFTQKNIRALTAMGDKSGLLVNFNNLEGGYYMHGNRQREALERYYTSLKIADETGDPLSKIKSIGNIGWAFMELNRFDTAIVYFKRCIALMEANKINYFAAVYNNIASCYGEVKQYDSAMSSVNKGIEVARQNNDLIAEANGLNILGTVYQARGRYDDALKVLLEAKTIREKLGDPFFIVSDMATIAELYAKTGSPQKGIDICRQALQLAVENNITTKFPMIYAALALNYEAAGNYRAAADVYRKINALKDSIYADASPQALAEMQTKYETEKKERKISEQQNRISRQNLLITGSIMLFVLSGLLAITQYRRYQWKQKARLRTEILKQQELSIRAVIDAEEAERQRIAKDLHDGVGQMMSAAKMNLSAYEHRAGFDNGEDKQAFENIITLVDESCREVRAVAHNMMPNALLKNNLADAIREFINKLDTQKLQVHVYTEGLDQRLEANKEAMLYRVIQESVNNVIRHAQADILDISIISETHEITATIEDNGKGFDPQLQSEGMGLKNIRTRIGYLKGTVEVNSTPGKGTLIAIHVPL
jgi:signal transduction histidine kinase